MTVDNGWVVHCDDPSRRDPAAAVIARAGGQPIDVQATTKPGDEKSRYASHSFGAVFAEVHVDAELGTIRVPRIVGVYSVGSLLNAKTARSQLIGGMVWGSAPRSRKARISTCGTAASRTRISLNITCP